MVNEQSPRLAAVVLAAGAAARFGSAKQLAELDGSSLVVRTVRALAPVCDAGVLVVTGAWHEAVTAALAAEPARCVYNPRWREGIAASLRQGIGALGGDVDAVLVALADQPGLGSPEYRALADAWRAAPQQPAAAVYHDQPGVPAIFPRSAWPGLARLHGDRGARAVLRDAQDLTRVAIPAAAWDVDEPADLGKGPA